MMVTSVDRAVLHHVFVPASDFQQRSYSTALPYRVGGETLRLRTIPPRVAHRCSNAR